MCLDMALLRIDYDRQIEQLAEAQQQQQSNKSLTTVTGGADEASTAKQQEQRRLAVAEQMRAVQSKVAALRGDLIGGERANDLQLREKHKKKKAAAARRLRYIYVNGDHPSCMVGLQDIVVCSRPNKPLTKNYI